MPRLHTDKTPVQGEAGKKKVAKAVENFVADKFIPVSETVIVQDPVVVDDDGIVQRSSPSQSVPMKVVDITLEAEGPRRTDLPAEAFH